jgi:LL-diaminopimelate aminotransferase
MEKCVTTPSNKILKMPKYIFAELDEWKEEARAKGVDLIDLGIGNPDGATPQPIVEAAVRAIQDPKTHGYPSFKGKPEFREAISEWLKGRYGIDIDPVSEIQTLIGEKEGLANVALAFTNPGDINIVPDPYYPVLSRGTWISSGNIYHVPLLDENNYLPDLKSIPQVVAKRAKIFFINYPNNPTGACATREFLEEVVAFCKKYQILLVSDLAYGEVCYDEYCPLSIFNIEGAKVIAIDFYSFSKTFNMAGWRVGFACGKKEFIDALSAMKNNIDYGTATIVQDAAIAALKMPYSYVSDIMDKYSTRREFFAHGLNKLGWKMKRSCATMYFWLKVPKGYKSKEFCKMVLDKTGVVFTPGIAFGDYSDDHFRVSIVQSDERLKEALERLEKADIRFESLQKI